MNIKDFLAGCLRFLSNKRKMCLFLLGILGCAAAAEFAVLGLARRTFVFYSIGSGKIIVEDRMLKRFPSREQDISWYVEEAILGSALPGVWPLFPKGVKLRSLLLRDGVVYADFSEEAALPPEEGMDVFSNLQILYAGIRRNFSVVRDVRFFIMGKAVFFEEFKKIFDEESKKRS